jgi:HK97 family phage portal protein
MDYHRRKLLHSLRLFYFMNLSDIDIKDGLKPAPAKRNFQPGFFSGAGTYTGRSVTPDSALTVTAFYAGVRVISETVASLPLIVYERLDNGGKRRAIENPLYSLLHDSPNDLMTSFEYRETIQTHLLIYGNALSEIDYNGRGGISQAWPLDPSKVHNIQKKNGKLYYWYERPDHSFEWISGDRIWHLRGLGSDGLWGYSPIQLMKNSLGISLATEEFAGRFFGNGAQLSGVLKHPGVLGDDAFDRIQDSWGDRYGGLSNAHKTAILEEGMEYQQISIPPEDAQFLQTRQFQITEVARMLRIPPHMIGDLTRSTNNNIEQQSIDFVTNTIRPWLVRWEQSIQKNLMLSSQRSRYFAEFLVDGLLRGDAKTRHDTYSIGRQNGYYSANDVRMMENLNPIPDGDMYLVPLNMTPADQAGQNEPTPPDNSQNRALLPESVETRAKRSAAGRSQLIRDFEPLFTETMQRSVRREVVDVKRQAKKTVGNDDLSAFLLWLPDYYEAHRAYMDKSLAPIFTAYMGAIVRQAKSELSNDADVTLTEFVAAYLETYTSRYSAKQQKYILAEIERTQADDGDVLAAIEAKMDEYDETRAGQEAARETRRMNNAIALAAYGALGATVKRWETVSDNCPYCNQLKGRTIAIEENFINKGDAIVADGVSPLPITSNIGHPPAHDGCDCMVVAG